MATAEDVKVPTPVEDLEAGDIIDLYGDTVADEEDFGFYANEYSAVQFVEVYDVPGGKMVAVEFLHDGLEDVIAFPQGHLIKVIRNPE